MLLGQQLIQANLLTIEQVQVALQSQVVHGGRIGSNLLRLGLLDIDTLSTTLGTHYGVPPAKLKHFEQAERAALSMIPGASALKYHAIPLASSPRTKELIVAFRDPQDLAAIDDLTFITGVRIKPFVAAEVCIQRYLERFYGDKAGAIPMGLPPERAPSASMPPRSSSSSMPPMRPSRQSMPPRMPSQRISIAMGQPETPPSGDFVPPAPDAADAVPMAATYEFVVPDQPWQAPAATMQLFPLPADMRPTPAPTPAELPIALALALPIPEIVIEEPILLKAEDAIRHAVTLEDALGRIEAADTKDAIAQAIVDHLRSSYGCGLILIVKDGIGLGWAGFAPGVEAETIASITVPLNSTSMFHVPWENKTLFRGAPAEESAGIQARFFKLLHCEPPTEVITVPIALKDRVVNIIYVHAFDGGELHGSATFELARLSAVAGEAFLRLIMAKKSLLP